MDGALDGWNVSSMFKCQPSSHSIGENHSPSMNWPCIFEEYFDCFFFVRQFIPVETTLCSCKFEQQFFWNSDLSQAILTLLVANVFRFRDRFLILPFLSHAFANKKGHTRQGLRCRICKSNVHVDCAAQMSKCQTKQKLLRRQKSTSEIVSRGVDSDESEYSVFHLYPFHTVYKLHILCV